MARFFLFFFLEMVSTHGTGALVHRESFWMEFRVFSPLRFIDGTDRLGKADRYN